MSQTNDVVMPQLGQAMEYGSITEWMVSDGETVSKGQAIATVEGDKAAYELEATADGVLHHIARLGDEIPVGEAVARIGDPDDNTVSTSTETPQAAPQVTAPVTQQANATAEAPVSPPGRPLSSPKARGMAADAGIDIGSVVPRRSDGLIVAADVEQAIAATTADPSAVPMSRLRQTAAKRLSQSWQQAPHFVQMIELDASQLMVAKMAIRENRLACSLNDIVIKAAADTLAKFPDINARYTSSGLVMADSVNVGLAIATDDGLMVPVLRDVDKGSLSDLAQASTGLIDRTLNNNLQPDDLGGGNITVSNLGRYGVAFGTPVLNLDEPILIFLGAIEEKPVAENGQIVLRPMTTLSVCFDHRVVDGLRAAEFCQALKASLQSLDGMLPATQVAQSAPDSSLEERQIIASSPNKLAVDIHSAKHSWRVDEPPSLGGDDSAPDPVTIALSGLASCMIVAFKLVAKRRKLTIDKIEAKLMATPTGKVKEITISLEVWSPADSSKVEKVLSPAKKACYVHDMLRGDLPVKVNLTTHSTG